MKKILLVILIFLLALGFTACGEKTEKYVDEDGNTKEFTYVTKETGDKFALMEEALTAKGLVFNVETKADGVIEGAKEGRKYTLEDGRVFEIFCYDIENEAYKEMAKTSKMYIEMFDAYIPAAINKEYALIPENDAEIKEMFMALK